MIRRSTRLIALLLAAVALGNAGCIWVGPGPRRHWHDGYWERGNWHRGYYY